MVCRWILRRISQKASSYGGILALAHWSPMPPVNNSDTVNGFPADALQEGMGKDIHPASSASWRDSTLKMPQDVSQRSSSGDRSLAVNPHLVRRDCTTSGRPCRTCALPPRRRWHCEQHWSFPSCVVGRGASCFNATRADEPNETSWRLLRALFGCRRAPRLWHDNLTMSRAQHDFALILQFKRPLFDLAPRGRPRLCGASIVNRRGGQESLCPSARV